MKKDTFFIVLLLLSAFKTVDYKSGYNVPNNALSVICTDIDQDNDIDIITGHKRNPTTNWGGIAILENHGNGLFSIKDSLFIDYGFPYISVGDFDNNSYPDIYGDHISTDPYTIYAGVLYNYGLTHFDNFQSFQLSNEDPVHFFSSGDINNDTYNDIVFACNLGRYWGVIYNNGSGSFPSPKKYGVDFYPLGIACGDLNNDNRDDM